MVHTTPVWEYHWSGTTAVTIRSVPPTEAWLPMLQLQVLREAGSDSDGSLGQRGGSQAGAGLGAEDRHACRAAGTPPAPSAWKRLWLIPSGSASGDAVAGRPLRLLGARDFGLGERGLGRAPGRGAEDHLVGREGGEGRRRLVSRVRP